jgi:hypothetical protein
MLIHYAVSLLSSAGCRWLDDLLVMPICLVVSVHDL